LQIYSGGEKTPAPGTSKCYAFEFKGKIAREKFFEVSPTIGPNWTIFTPLGIQRRARISL
jgi:hypothetical protein